MCACNFGASGSNLTTFPRDVPRGRHDNFGTTFGDPHPSNFGGQKNPNFGAISDNFDCKYLYGKMVAVTFFTAHGVNWTIEKISF